MEVCDPLEVKEEHDPFEVKELATPAIKKEVEEAQLETTATGWTFLVHFLYIFPINKIIKCCISYVSALSFVLYILSLH